MAIQDSGARLTRPNQPLPYEVFQVARPDPDRVHDPEVRQLAAIAESVDGRAAHAEVLRDVAHLEQLIAAAPGPAGRRAWAPRWPVVASSAPA